jgi:hypothetical protein
LILTLGNFSKIVYTREKIEIDKKLNLRIHCLLHFLLQTMDVLELNQY